MSLVNKITIRIQQNFEPLTDTIKNLTKPITETSINNNTALENLNEIREIMFDRGIIASYLLPPLTKIINFENTSQYKLIKDSN